MRIRSIKANVHQISAEVLPLAHPLRRRRAFCAMATGDGHTVEKLKDNRVKA